MIGIIGAMEVEIAKLIERLEEMQKVFVAGKEIYLGKIFDKDVAIARCGIGKVNSAMICQILISEFKASTILNTGVAGALFDNVNVKDVVIANDLVYHDFDTSYFEGDTLGQVPGIDTFGFNADKEIIDILKKSAIQNLSEKNVFVGRIASGDQFVSDFKKKGSIKIYFEAMAVDMESTAIAHVCYLNKVPFGIIRSISDNADSSADVDFNNFVEESSIISAKIVFDFLSKF